MKYQLLSRREWLDLEWGLQLGSALAVTTTLAFVIVMAFQ